MVTKIKPRALIVLAKVSKVLTKLGSAAAYAIRN